jgi:hypothetical protein
MEVWVVNDKLRDEIAEMYCKVTYRTTLEGLRKQAELKDSEIVKGTVKECETFANRIMELIIKYK